MNIGDRVRVVNDTSRFCGETGVIQAFGSTESIELCLVTFDNKSVSVYESLYFVQFELELVK